VAAAAARLGGPEAEALRHLLVAVARPRASEAQAGRAAAGPPDGGHVTDSESEAAWTAAAEPGTGSPPLDSSTEDSESANFKFKTAKSGEPDCWRQP
jgi:hypothetical protein